MRAARISLVSLAFLILLMACAPILTPQTMDPCAQGDVGCTERALNERARFSQFEDDKRYCLRESMEMTVERERKGYAESNLVDTEIQRTEYARCMTRKGHSPQKSAE